jgi:cell division transport system ATP-binding protein
MITFTNVSKLYQKEHAAIKNINLTIPDGDFVFLIGHSGAGKSTLLKLVRRVILPSEGTIMVDDWDVSTLSSPQIFQLRRMVGMVFQDYKILETRTVFENISIALEILHKTEEEIKREVGDILDLVGLSEKHTKFPQQLSAGEQQRVSLARAIVGGPKILLADEPTGNLDPETSEGIFDILNEVNKIGTTVVIATHNDVFVNKMQKRTITLKKGEIIRDEEKGVYHSKKMKNQTQ